MFTMWLLAEIYQYESAAAVEYLQYMKDK